MLKKISLNSLIVDANSKNNNGAMKEIIIEFSKEQLEKINGIENFNVEQEEDEIIFIVSFFSKSLSFKKLRN